MTIRIYIIIQDIRNPLRAREHLISCINVRQVKLGSLNIGQQVYRIKRRDTQNNLQAEG